MQYARFVILIVSEGSPPRRGMTPRPTKKFHFVVSNATSFRMTKKGNMYLIIGLGNPGDEYKTTRHNIGRETVALMQKIMAFPDFSISDKWKAEVAEGRIGKEKVVLLLPNTFMNKSGASVSPTFRYFKIKPGYLLLIHDDVDIALGRTKMSFGKRSAGHKGVESVIRAVHTRDFWRFRLGIAGKRDIPAETLVLRTFTPDQLRTAKKAMKRTIKAIEMTIMQGPNVAMNEYNR